MSEAGNSMLMVGGRVSSTGRCSPDGSLHRTQPGKRRSNEIIPSKPMFSADHYCNPIRPESPQQGKKERPIRRRPRHKQSSATESADSSHQEERTMTYDSIIGQLSELISPINDRNNNESTVLNLEICRKKMDDLSSEVSIPHINELSNIPVTNGMETDNKNSYNSEQFRQKAEQTRLKIRAPRSSHITTPPIENGAGSDNEHTDDHSINTHSKTLALNNEAISQIDDDVDMPMGASEQQRRLIQSKGYMEASLKRKLDKKIDETDQLISGLKECHLKNTIREQVFSATKEVQNTVKPQIIRDPQTSLRSYKVNLDMGQYLNALSHVVNNREVTVIGRTVGDQVFTKEMKVQFPINVNMDTLAVEVQEEYCDAGRCIQEMECYLKFYRT